MNSDFNLVFRGEVALDHDISATREKFAKMFKASDEKIELLFSGRSVVVKKGLSAEDGIKWQRQMLQIGAITYLEELKVRDSVRSKSPSNTSSYSRDVKKSTLLEPTSRRAVSASPSLTLQPLDEIPRSVEEEEGLSDAASAASRKKFGIPDINFSFSVATSFALVLVGVACMLAFSPYPDLIVRKGLAIGGILIFIGVRRLMR